MPGAAGGMRNVMQNDAMKPCTCVQRLASLCGYAPRQTEMPHGEIFTGKW